MPSPTRSIVRFLPGAAAMSLFVLSAIGALPTTPATGPGFTDAPAWARQAVWYQIFPERFRNGDPHNDPTVDDIALAWPHERPAQWSVSRWTGDWYALQLWETEGNKGFYFRAQQRRYGGDLEGVREKLDYLQSLGVTAIYFNPLFEAASLHKYDATYYHHIDNNFGPDPAADARLWSTENPADPATWKRTTADTLFLGLVRDIHHRGMKVIIDGVFNHVGTSFWAFRDVRKNGPRSLYKDWFQITSWDNPATSANEFAYVGWSGVKDLPQFNRDSVTLAAGPRKHIQAVVKWWMDPNGDGDPSDGIDGWRLDVADVVPQGFWKEFRTWVRAINPQAYITGEVWWKDYNHNVMFNAGPWLRGDMFDAVMNYRWANEVGHFFKDRKFRTTPSEFDRRLRALREDYRADVNNVLMNLLDSHDTDRLPSQIVNPDLPYDHDAVLRDDSTYDVRKPNADELVTQKLMVLYQMTSLGAPMVYYGDEAGMWGADDPDERKPMLWEDLVYDNERSHPFGKARPDDPNVFNRDLFEYYKTLIALRKSHQALSLGDYRALLTDDTLNLYAFERILGDSRIVVVINNSTFLRDVAVPVGAQRPVKWNDLLRPGNPPAEQGSGVLHVSLAGRSGAILDGVR